MKTIKEFESAVRRFNRQNAYRTFTQIAFDPNYYDILTLFDSELEIDLFTFNENTAKELVKYLESLNTQFLKPDYFPNLSSDFERLGITGSIAEEVYNNNKKFNGTCEEKYQYDEKIKRFRIQIRVGGKNIKTLFDFIKNTKEDLLSLSKAFEDAIEIRPYQLDNIVDGSIIYFNGEEYSYKLTFNFDANSPRESFVTACMLNQTVRDQKEFDELRFQCI